MTTRLKIIAILLSATALVIWIALGLLLPTTDPALSPHQTSSSPQRIVSLAPNITEILFALDLGDKVVGVTRQCDWPAEALNKPGIGNFWQPDIEAIIALDPDLILIEMNNAQRSIAERLQRLGYTAPLLVVDTIDQLWDAVAQIGQLTGSQSQADQLVTDMQREIEYISSLIAGRPRPRVLWIVQPEPLRVAGRATFINEIIELAGGENAIGPTLHVYPPLGMEQVMAASVDVIIQPAMFGYTPIEQQQRDATAYWSHWSGIPAVRHGRVHVIEAAAVSRLGPRLATGVASVAGLLHPRLAEPDGEPQQ